MRRNLNSNILIYEDLYEDFNDALINKLRNHSVSVDFLTLWVPDEDHIKSIESMVDAAKQDGKTELAFSVSFSTIKQSDIATLVNILQQYGSCSIETSDETVVFHINDLQQKKTIQAKNISDHLAKEKVLEVAENEKIAMPDVLQKVALSYANRGKCDTEIFIDSGILKQNRKVIIKVNDVEVYFFINSDDGIVSDVKYRYANDEILKGLLEIYCLLAKGVAIYEVLEHQVLKVLYFMVDQCEGQIVTGILLPQNCGDEFLILRKINIALKQKLEKIDLKKFIEGNNEYDKPPNKSWIDMDNIKRLDVVREYCDKYLHDKNLEKDTIRILSIESDLSGWFVRVFTEFPASVHIDEKPSLLRSLEKFLKYNLEKKLQLYHAESKDKNTIRRL